MAKGERRRTTPGHVRRGHRDAVIRLVMMRAGPGSRLCRAGPCPGTGGPGTPGQTPGSAGPERLNAEGCDAGPGMNRKRMFECLGLEYPMLSNNIIMIRREIQ